MSKRYIDRRSALSNATIYKRKNSISTKKNSIFFLFFYFIRSYCKVNRRYNNIFKDISVTNRNHSKDDEEKD